MKVYVARIDAVVSIVDDAITRACARFFGWLMPRKTMSTEELLRRIDEDMTDDDIDRMLPPSLRKNKK